MTSSAASEGLLDTSVVIALPQLADPAVLPALPYVSTVTLAELSVGPLVARTPAERAARQVVLQQAEADFDPLPFDAAAARVRASRRRAARSGTQAAVAQLRRDDRCRRARPRAPALHREPR